MKWLRTFKFWIISLLTARDSSIPAAEVPTVTNTPTETPTDTPTPPTSTPVPPTNKNVARFQILCWEHIPLGVKATDGNGTVQKKLPARFMQAVENASAQAGYNKTDYTSSFKWGKEEERAGSAAEVAAAVAKELDETWDEEKALAQFNDQR
jgi:hypothetical protein